MLDNVDNGLIDGLAWALGSLFVVMLIACLVPVIILDRIGVPRKFTDKFIGLFGLLGFGFWIYGMFYLNLYELFI